MPSGSAVENFADYLLATGATRLGGPEKIQLEAPKHTHHIARVIEGDLAKKKILAGGRSVRHDLIFKHAGTFGPYLPGAFRNYRLPQRLNKVESFFRYNEAHTGYLETEILQNEVGMSSEDAMYHQFTSLREKIRAIGEADVWDGMEGRMWAVPDKNIHEGESNGNFVMDVMPIMAVINEWPDGLFRKGQTGGVDWTTIFGVNPADAAVNGKFSPQVSDYTSAAAGLVDNMLAACDEIVLKLGWQLPKTLQKWAQDERSKKLVGITSMRGRTHLVQLMRADNDRYLLGPQDPGNNNPQIYGIPIEWSEDFQNGAYYDDGSNGLVTEMHANAADKGPRILFWDGNTYWPFFHREKYLVMNKPQFDYNTPDTFIVRTQVWWNWICVSRQRQGIVKPEGAIITS